jgi:hypothetical protein
MAAPRRTAGGARAGEHRGDMGLAKELGGAPFPLSDFHDDRHFTIFHFATAEAAQAFHTRFGGELLPVVEDKPGRRRRRR